MYSNILSCKPGHHVGLPPYLRQMSTRALVALNLIGRCAIAPVITRGRNGRGCDYRQMWIYHPTGRWQSMYLGTLHNDEESLLREQIRQRCVMSRAEYHRRVHVLRQNRQRLKDLTQAIAIPNGYHFRGWLLYRKSDAPVDSWINSLELLHQTLLALKEANAELQAIYQSRLTGPVNEETPLRPRWYRRTLSAWRAVCSAHAQIEASIRKLQRHMNSRG
jgi:hypothetical protein